MTAPVPEESNEAYDLDAAPPGEHAGELPDGSDGDTEAAADGGSGTSQEENAETSLDQPSQ